jgi:ferredoxin
MSLSGTPRFRDRRCTRYRFRYSECRRCADACPHEAIGLDDAGARIDTDRCRDCGLCISACHTGAWESDSFQPIELLRQAIRKTTWRVTCAPAGGEADAVVPCLGALPAATLAYLARRGIEATLSGCEHCADCVHGPVGHAQLRASLDAVGALHDAVVGSDDTRWAMPVIDRASRCAAHPPRSSNATAPRRGLLRRLVRRAADDLTVPAEGPPPAPPPAKAIRAGSHCIPEQRDLLQIVCKRSDDNPIEMPLDDALPMMQLSLQPGCTVCEACFRVCPTGALQIEENPGDWALTFDGDRCVGCLVCLEVCQPRVLQPDPVVDLRPGRAPARLLGMNKQRCKRCDRHFVSVDPQEQCAVCTDDQDAFSAIFG